VTAPGRPDILPLVGETIDMSEGGLRARVRTPPAEGTDLLHVDIVSDFSTAASLPARLVGAVPRGDQTEIRLAFIDLTPAHERAIIEIMFTDPDSWTHRPRTQHPLQSLVTVVYAPWRALVLSLRDDESEAPPA
jgi:hypothetical protein